MTMGYGKDHFKEASQAWRRGEDYVVDKVDDVNSKKGRKWALIVSVGINIAQALAIASLVWGSGS